MIGQLWAACVRDLADPGFIGRIERESFAEMVKRVDQEILKSLGIPEEVLNGSSNRTAAEIYFK
jgi:hypothetical protein